MEGRYRARFLNKHTVLPVIHASTYDQVLRNVQIAATAGAEGVFLVNHVIPHQDLFGIHEETHRQFPELWIGLNCLDLNPTWVTTYPGADGMWADAAWFAAFDPIVAPADAYLDKIIKREDLPEPTLLRLQEEDPR